MDIMTAMAGPASVRLSENPSASADPAPAGLKGPYLRLHAINIFVRDQDLSLRFYLDQLGFQLAFDVRLEPGDRWVAVSPPDGTGVLALIAPPPDSQQYKLIGRPTGVTFVTDNMTATYRQWKERGVRFRHAPRLRRVKNLSAKRHSGKASQSSQSKPVWGGVFTRFEDLDGNSFGLLSLDELTEALESQRRAAAEKAEQERRAAHELEIAKQVQARLFPQRLPRLRSLDYAGVCLQARQVGGDYYDFLDLGLDDLGHIRLGLVLGDISGKGMGAALLMANLQANLRSQCAIAVHDPERLLRSVNELFYRNTAANDYSSLFFAEYEDHTRRLRYANCGHLSALLFRSDGAVERLSSTCTVLGLFQQWDCALAERYMAPGDLLALYTDGVTESFNLEGEEFGEQRVIELVRRHHALPPEALLDAIVEDVQRFSCQEQHDDVTVIVARAV